jgi:hypothetical protein
MIPKILLIGIILAISSVSFAQTTPAPNATSFARMTLDNYVTIRSGVHEVYKISMNHFSFASTAEAEAYFEARKVDFITFQVDDENTVYLKFDLENSAVQSWTINEWMIALDKRADKFEPRILPTN